ncbi:MAG: aminotransferase class IV [Bacteroidia bacterium]|nr:aminotransferase class IV [Bacteroidia bacterium]
MLQKFDPRNENIQVFINGKLYPRDAARVSVFDSIVQGGDGVWEGLRVYNGRIFCLDKHLDRLMNSAHALDFKGIPSREDVKSAIFQTLQANQMRDGVHIRLTLTRGEKITSGMDPRLNTKGCTLIVLAEWKSPVYDQSGIRLVTSSIRRNGPQFLDSKIHHNNLLNNILAKIEANFAGVDDALMLDQDGFVAETNATNVFLVKNGVLQTPTAVACLPGITRGLVMEIARQAGIEVREGRLSVVEFYTSDEVFVTGTMGELTPVREIDGRLIQDRTKKGVLARINQIFRLKTETEGELIP